MSLIKGKLSEALEYRKKSSVPDVTAIIISVTVFVLVYILFAIAVHPVDRTLDYHFYSERGIVTGLSVIFLAMAGTFSMATMTIHLKDKIQPMWPWLLMALGFLFLALDETAQFHERLGDFFDDRVDSGSFRNWNDVIVILYGVIAIPFIVLILPSITRYKMVLEIFITAFVFYVLHTVIDSTQEPSTTVSIIFEESAKLYCGAFLAMSMFFSFLGALYNNEH